MKKLPERPRTAVVGATGVVGRTMLDLLEERRFPASEVVAVATPRSAGRSLPFGDQTLTVRAIGPEVFDGVDLVLLDTPDDAARLWAPVAVEHGAVVVDNSAAWRMEESVPLVVPEVNASDIDRHRGIIASPNCTTVGIVLPLAALHRRFGLEDVVVASYQAVSGAGKGGVEELAEQTRKMSDQIEGLGDAEVADAAPAGKAFPAPIAFNVIPQAGSVRGGGYTSEEWKLLHESRKIMGMPELRVTATCVRVPTVAGHGAAVHVRCFAPVDVDAALEALAAAPGVELADLPTALLAAGRDASYVGRVRVDQADGRALWFFCTCDNLRKGAALNAVQIAEQLLPNND